MKRWHILLFGMLAIIASSCRTTPNKDAPFGISKAFTEAVAPI